MSDEALLLRIERFERTVATCLCVVPFLFSCQSLIVALCAPVAANMFKDFGAKLPWPTQFVLGAWPGLVLLAVVLPIVALIIARKKRAHISIIFSTVTGLLIFGLAQFVTIALVLPIIQLGAVAAGG